MPRPESFGTAVPQPAFSAARSHDGGLALRSADRVRGGAGVAPRAIEEGQSKRDGIGTRRVRRLVHEALDGPIGPARPDRAQPTGPKGAVGEIVRERPHALRAHGVPMICARDREGIVELALQAFRHLARRHDQRGPAGGGVMLHAGDLAARRRTPCASVWIEGERNESKRISSGRVSTIFTGLPSALAASAAGTV